MDFELSFRNVSSTEASQIFASLATALKKPVAEANPVPTKEDVLKAVQAVTESTPAKEEVIAPEIKEPEIKEPKKTKKKAEVPQAEPEGKVPQAEPEAEIEETVTLDTLRARTRKIAQADKANSAKIIALLKKAGADSLPKLKPELYVKFNKELDKLDTTTEADIDDDLPF